MGVKEWGSTSGERYIIVRPGTVQHPARRWGVYYKHRIYACFDDMKEAIAYRDELLKAVALGEAIPKPARKKKTETRATARKQSKKTGGQVKKSCSTCKYRGQIYGSQYSCKYYDVPGHTSRVVLHYQRIGRESLDGFTYDKNCTEYEGGSPLKVRFDGSLDPES